jgi:NAD(P)H-hydrate epimerase
MDLERVEEIPRLPRRAADSHKGDYGRVLVVAGGRGMAGAAALVGAAALRSGAGLVRVACPAEVQPTVASFEPSYMTYPLTNDGDGLICPRPGELERLVESADVLACGPGLGRSDGLRTMLRWVLESVTVPTVLDADALNNLDGQLERLQGLKRPVILTPHAGEMGRLLGKSAAEVQADREGAAVGLARAENLIVVLKGHQSLVTDGRRVYVNTTGNPGMATGGAGDCLTGVIAAMLAQGLEAFEAAVLGTFAHGLAGDLARDQNGEIGLIAGDIVDSLADAFYHMGAA